MSGVYSYCLELEYALLQLYGKKSRWYGMAGSFSKESQVREAIIAASRRFKSRLKQILTADDRLLLTTSLTLEALHREANNLGKVRGAELRVIAYLIDLVAHLLGYDWMLGRPNRHIVYFQTIDQQWRDDHSRHPVSSVKHMSAVDRHRLQIVVRLHHEGLRPYEVADVLNISEARVKDMLVRAGKVERKRNIKAQ